MVKINCQSSTHAMKAKGTRYLGLGGGGVGFWLGSDPRSAPIHGGGGVSAKVRSTIRIKKCHNPDQKVHLPIFCQRNKPVVLLNSVCCCDYN